MHIDEADTKALEYLKPEYGSTIQTGDILIKEGERDLHVHFIISGLIRSISR